MFPVLALHAVGERRIDDGDVGRLLDGMAAVRSAIGG